MTAETATIEVLTAEVRVLQVGRRQVTLSVFKQLDICTPNGIEPFGRVNHDDDDFHHWGAIDKNGTWVGAQRCPGACPGRHDERTWIVGRHRDTGELVRCWDWCGDTEWDALPLIVLAGLR